MVECIIKRNIRSQNSGTCQKCVKNILRPQSSLENNVTVSLKFTQTSPNGAKRGAAFWAASSCKSRLSEGVTEVKKTFLCDMREARVEHYKLDWDHGS
jgi:hypothetical protein